MKKLLITLTLLTLTSIMHQSATAQIGLGVSFEERPDAPQQGFGIQLESELLPITLLGSIRARLHGSYFSQDASLSVPLNNSPSVEFGKIQSYDFGAALLGGLNLGFFSPYVGLGAGLDNWRFDLSNSDLRFDEQTINYYGLLGASLTIFPKLKPYVEYRVSEYGSIDDVRQQIDEDQGRFIIGVTLKF
jgi:opacity protein-like surface antigen